MEPSELATAKDPRSVLREVCAQLQSALRAGEECCAEDFLQAHPLLAETADYAVTLIVTEWITRRALAQPLNLEEWLTRFPQWREELHRELSAQRTPSLRELDKASTILDRKEGTGVARTLSPLTAPQNLDHHELLDILGQGGMGVVYRARDPVLNREVALKKILSGVLAGPEEVQRFYREAQAAAQIHHPNIVAIHSMGMHQGQHCFTMALVTGGCLSQHIPRFAGKVREGVQLMHKVTHAVQAAHDKGILHRDLKPGNILLNQDGEALVSDFGLAKFCDRQADMTLPGQLVGTPAYMSPEQAAGHTWKISKRSDVWSLGVILYELLTGQRPFTGDRAEDVFQQILTSQPVPPHVLQSEVKRDLETILLRCLEKDPARRYSSAGELADDLGRWLRGEPIAGRQRWWGRGWVSSRGRLGAFLGLVLVLIIAVFALVPGRNSSPPQEQPLADRPLALIAADQLPAGGHWSLGQGSYTRLENEVIQLESKSLGLFELCSSVPWKQYRLRIDIQILDPGTQGAGIYFAAQEQETDQGRDHWFHEWSFSEQNIHKPTEKHQKLYAASTVWGKRSTLLNDRKLPSHNKHGGYKRHFSGKPGTWRQLLLEVTPNAISCFWDKEPEPFVTLHTISLNREFKSLAMLSPGNIDPPVYLVTGSLGLVCQQGAARFRRAVLEPLQPQK